MEKLLMRGSGKWISFMDMDQSIIMMKAFKLRKSLLIIMTLTKSIIIGFSMGENYLKTGGMERER